MQDHSSQIHHIFEHGNMPTATEAEVIEAVIKKIDEGTVRVCEKINNQWHFYIQSYPTNGFNRKELNPKRAYLSTEIIERVIKNLIEDGYYFKGKCNVNYNYVDNKNWFADWRRLKHIEFLNNKW